jgi:hypothetical protein
MCDQLGGEEVANASTTEFGWRYADEWQSGTGRLYDIERIAAENKQRAVRLN